MKKNVKTLIFAAAVTAGLAGVVGPSLSMNEVHAEELQQGFLNEDLYTNPAVPPEEKMGYAYSLDPNGGTCETDHYFVGDGETVTLPTPVNGDLDFLGWYDENGNNVTVGTPETGNLKAYWGYSSWMVRAELDANGGTCEKDFYSVTREEPTCSLPTPVRENYDFDGWYDKKGNKVTEGTSSTGDLIAHWTSKAAGDEGTETDPKDETKDTETDSKDETKDEETTPKETSSQGETNPVTFILDVQGGECGKHTYTVSDEHPTVVLPTPTKADNEFIGWYDKDGHKVTEADASTGTVTARWMPLIKTDEGVKEKKTTTRVISSNISLPSELKVETTTKQTASTVTSTPVSTVQTDSKVTTKSTEQTTKKTTAKKPSKKTSKKTTKKSTKKTSKKTTAKKSTTKKKTSNKIAAKKSTKKSSKKTAKKSTKKNTSNKKTADKKSTKKTTAKKTLKKSTKKNS